MGTPLVVGRHEENKDMAKNPALLLIENHNNNQDMTEVAEIVKKISQRFTRGIFSS